MRRLEGGLPDQGTTRRKTSVAVSGAAATIVGVKLHWKNLLVPVAIMALGMAQLFGVQFGYWCDCSHQVIDTAVCDTDTCHPDHAGATADRDSRSHPSRPAALPCQNPEDHRHEKRHHSLDLSHAPPLLGSPPLILFGLPEAFQLVALNRMPADFSKSVCPAPPEHGPPPMPLLVARTMVILI